jgi:hypothetical protein
LITHWVFRRRMSSGLDWNGKSTIVFLWVCDDHIEPLGYLGHGSIVIAMHDLMSHVWKMGRRFIERFWKRNGCLTEKWMS